MKKILCLMLAAIMVLAMAACGGDTPSETTPPADTTPVATQPVETQPVETQPVETQPVIAAPVDPWDLDFASDVNTWGGNWVLASVYVDGTEYPAVENALSLEIKMEEDPSELVDDAAYIHNRVWNLTGYLTFGIQEIVDELAADDVESYKGTTGWNDFPQGKVVAEGQWYEQPGPALMRFKDIDDYGLFLDKIAGIEADIDTTEKSLVIGQNGEGQLLLGFSEEHIERPGVEGEFVYVLVFNKAA